MIASPVEIDGDAEDAFGVLARGAVVRNQRHHLIRHSGNRQIECRVTAASFDVPLNPLAQPEQLRRVVQHLDGIHVGAHAVGRPCRHPVGARKDHRARRDRVPSEEKLRVRVASKRHRHDVVCLVGRSKTSTALLGTIQDRGCAPCMSRMSARVSTSAA